MPKIPDELLGQLKAHIVSIGKLFKSPKITLIVRGPDLGNSSGDLILTTDNPMLAEQALHARVVAEAKIWANTPEQMRVIETPRTDAPPPVWSDDLDNVRRPSGNNFDPKRP